MFYTRNGVGLVGFGLFFTSILSRFVAKRQKQRQKTQIPAMIQAIMIHGNPSSPPSRPSKPGGESAPGKKGGRGEEGGNGGCGGSEGTGGDEGGEGGMPGGGLKGGGKSLQTSIEKTRASHVNSSDILHGTT